MKFRNFDKTVKYYLNRQIIFGGFFISLKLFFEAIFTIIVTAITVIRVTVI
jgi:hypothetical protein